MPDDVHLIKEIRDIRARRLLRTLAVVQDLSDALMAINDVTGTAVSFYVSRPSPDCCVAVSIVLVISDRGVIMPALMGFVID